MPKTVSITLTDGINPEELAPVERISGQTRYRGTSAATQAANLKLLFSNKFTGGVNKQYVRSNTPIVLIDSQNGAEIVNGEISIETTIRCPANTPAALRVAAVKRHFSLGSTDALEIELTTGEGHW